ncbi:MAG: PAS domain S-box protein [Cyanobacteria bacterium RI_101]|nr:PAS domain S-box protein [Cyanobacteria bacterium RI_101]
MVFRQKQPPTRSKRLPLAWVLSFPYALLILASLGFLHVWENQSRSQSGPILAGGPAQSPSTVLKAPKFQGSSPKIFWVAGLSVLGAVALGRGLSDWLLRPVKQITETCEDLAAEPRLIEDVLLGAKTTPILELAQLENALEEMLDQFQRQWADLEAQRQSSQNLCGHILQSQGELILRTSPEGRITFANLAVCNLWGRSLEEISGTSWRDWLSSQDYSALFSPLQRLSKAEPSFLAERFHSVGVSQARWIQWLGQGLFEPTGELREIQWVGRDISALKENQHLIERITETTPTLLYIYDQIENRNIYVNRSVTDLLGYSPQEVQAMGGNLLPTICHPEDFPRIMASQAELRTLPVGAEIRIDYRVRDARGKWRWLSSRDQVFTCAEDGRVHYTLGTAQDITERKEAELRLQQAQAFVGAILENIPDIVYVKDAQSLKIVRVNQAAEKLFGQRREKLLGKNNFHLFPSAQADVLTRQERQLLRAQKALDIAEEVVTSPTQGIRILRTQKIPMGSGEDKPRYLLVISQDVTERRESEQRLTQLAHHIPGVIYQFRMRPDGSFHFPYASDGIRDIYSVRPAQVKEDANPVLDVIHPEDRERVYGSVLDSALSLAPWECEYRVCPPNGRERWVRGHATPRRSPDGSVIWHGYINDVTERKQVELALADSQAKFATIFQTSPDPMWTAILETGLCIEVNRAFCVLLEYEPEQVIGKTCREFGFWDNLADLNYFRQRMMTHNEIENFEVVVRTSARQAKTVLLSAKVQKLGGQDCVLGTLKEITARKQMESFLLAAKERAELAELELQQAQLCLEEANSKLRQLVNTDSLTGVANRRCFDQRLEQEWLRLQRERQPLSLIVLDVDYFKKYNDFYGHPQGDRCLIQIAQALSSQVTRSTDLVARIGGEEFALLLPNTPLKGAETIAQRLQDYLANLNLPHLGAPLYQRVTISLGITTEIPSAASSPSALLSRADQALYLAKEQGRNRSVVFESAPA